METHKPLLKDADGEDVDEHLYRSMIGSFTYLTSSRPDIMFADSPFDLVAYTNSDYAGQTVVANSTTEAEYIVTSNCCGQALWIQNQMLDYRDSNEKKLIQMIKIYVDQNVVDLLTKAFDRIIYKGWLEWNAKAAKDGIRVKTENADFAEIVDFLNANPIRYALTVSPTIYVSYIEQLWPTAKTKIVNNETHIHAKVKGKTIVISESFVRRDIQFDDEDEVNVVYDTPSHTKNIFANMRRQGKDFSGTITPLFSSMLAQQAYMGKRSRQPTDPRHTTTSVQPSNEEPITVPSSSQPKKTHRPRKAKRATEISQSSGPIPLVTDETGTKKREDRMERAPTTASSLESEQGSGNINRTQSMATLNEPSPHGTGSGSGHRCQDTILGDEEA
ncbi:hypothetical protein Tco_1505874 [Tanacetum coccineum]